MFFFWKYSIPVGNKIFLENDGTILFIYEVLVSWNVSFPCEKLCYLEVEEYYNLNVSFEILFLLNINLPVWNISCFCNINIPFGILLFIFIYVVYRSFVFVYIC